MSCFLLSAWIVIRSELVSADTLINLSSLPTLISIAREIFILNDLE
jgi:hypothetical protein